MTRDKSRQLKLSRKLRVKLYFSTNGIISYIELRVSYGGEGAEGAEGAFQTFNGSIN